MKDYSAELKGTIVELSGHVKSEDRVNWTTGFVMGTCRKCGGLNKRLKSAMIEFECGGRHGILLCRQCMKLGETVIESRPHIHIGIGTWPNEKVSTLIVADNGWGRTKARRYGELCGQAEKHLLGLCDTEVKDGMVTVHGKTATIQFCGIDANIEEEVADGPTT